MSNSTRLMWLFWIVILLMSVLEPYLLNAIEPKAWMMISTLITLALMFMWFVADARDVGYQASRLLKVCVIAVGVIAIPYYLIKAKGLKRASLSFLKTLGFVVALIAILVVVEAVNPVVYGN